MKMNLQFFTKLTTAGLLLIGLLGACNQAPPARYKKSQDLNTEDYAERMRILVKDSSILDFFSFDEKGLRMYADSASKVAEKPEYHIFPEEIPLFNTLAASLGPDSLLALCLKKGTGAWPDSLLSKPITTDTFRYGKNKLKPLEGLRVALDPGHLAHNMEMAEIEGKYVKMLPSKATKGKKVAFFEAGHTLATAHFLKEKLEALGATVYMTRSRLDDYPLGLSYFEWKKTQAEQGMREALEKGFIDSVRAEKVRNNEVSEKEHFTWVYNQLDLRKRAELINSWKPHLTVIIHYNITQAAWRDRNRLGFFPAAKDNFCMTFTPGSFMKGELQRPIDRLSFARLLLTPDLDRSVSLSTEVVEEFHKKLKIPYVTAESPTSYIERACVYAGSPGVYARNLSLSRLVASPLVYGESLCQEYPDEALALSRTPFEIAGVPTSERVARVAEAYMAGILEWVKTTKNISYGPESSQR